MAGQVVITGLAMRYRATGKLVGIDRGSGGYPYEATYLCDVHTFTQKDAESYQCTFPELDIVKFTLTVEET